MNKVEGVVVDSRDDVGAAIRWQEFVFALRLGVSRPVEQNLISYLEVLGGLALVLAVGYLQQAVTVFTCGVDQDLLRVDCTRSKTSWQVDRVEYMRLIRGDCGGDQWEDIGVIIVE